MDRKWILEVGSEDASEIGRMVDHLNRCPACLRPLLSFGIQNKWLVDLFAGKLRHDKLSQWLNGKEAMPLKWRLALGLVSDILCQELLKEINAFPEQQRDFMRMMAEHIRDGIQDDLDIDRRRTMPRAFMAAVREAAELLRLDHPIPQRARAEYLSAWMN